RDKAGLQEVKPGTARIYDGSETIHNTDLVAENIRAPEFSASAPQMLFNVNIPDEYRASMPDFTANIGLWLTTTQPKSGIRPPYLNMVPKELPVSNLKVAQPTERDGRYFMTILQEDLPDSSMLEFIYSIANPAKSPEFGPLYGVRVNGSHGGLPIDWYNKLDTFKVKVRGIVYQRSGATILSNVINPTKGEKAVLNYILSRGGQVTVQVFTLDGVLVQTLFRGNRPAGEYVASWDGKNRGGNVVARGMYFIRIVAPDIDEIRKVMVVK
ncbi:MAG: T9SS type A sorting domain-containing protein, partial [Spirochaetaceae bacterium]|nr:T9SS type A sorting domain-containing protein [Spirochaetaceae bacterium]